MEEAHAAHGASGVEGGEHPEELGQHRTNDRIAENFAPPWVLLANCGEVVGRCSEPEHAPLTPPNHRDLLATGADEQRTEHTDLDQRGPT